MKKNNYLYNGIPILDYCRENDIKPNTVLKKIANKKNDKKYENMGEQEIVNMVIESFGNYIKYKYNGISLAKYCSENNINRVTIYNRIKTIIKDNPNISNDELVRQAVEYKDKIKYYYNGITLIEYCRQHQDISYDNVKSYIKKNLNDKTNVSDLINKYIEKKQNKISCCSLENNISGNVKTSKESKNNHYYYNEISLKQYCKDNNIPYSSVLLQIKANKGETNINDLIKSSIDKVVSNSYQYYYNNELLAEYCSQNNIDSKSVKYTIERIKVKSNTNIQEIVNRVVEAYLRLSNIQYLNMNLKEYCNNINIKYASVIDYYLCITQNSQENDEDLKKLIDQFIKKKLHKKEKYNIEGKNLKEYCKDNNYPYRIIQKRTKRELKKDNKKNPNKVVETSINNYTKKINYNKINLTFEELDKMKDPSMLSYFCDSLKVDKEQVAKLLYLGFTYQQAVKIIWLFKDTIENDIRRISKEKLNYVLKISDQDYTNYNDLPLIDIVNLYKCSLKDTRNIIIEKEKTYINKNINNLLIQYEIKYNKSLFEDILSEVKLQLLLIIEKSYIDNTGQFIKYIDLSLKGKIIAYIKKYKQNNCISLDEPIKEKNNTNQGKLSRIDIVKDKSQNIPSNEDFSEKMYKIISSLTKKELHFIILRYQENYSYEELANFYHTEIDQIMFIEQQLLQKLKCNQKIQEIKKNMLK